jgi:hypothetical protein
MKKTGNKFIILILFWVLLVSFIGLYKSYFFAHSLNDSFIVPLDGKAILNNKILKLDEKQLLRKWDKIRTIGKKSLAIIEWWDGSITRLGWNSSIAIEELLVSHDLWKINISFELLNGKSWSNVISFIWEGSYFKETFRDTEAAVRGTVFNVDLVSEYVYVLKHKILLTDNKWHRVEIDERKPFSLRTFSFIRLEEFIKNIKDKSFEQLNKSFDKEFIITLTNNLNNKLSDFTELSHLKISSFSQEKKDKLYNEILQQYQKLNFVDSGSKKLFEKKLEYKNALIELAGEKDKTILLNSILYDLKDTINLKNYWFLDEILPILNKNINEIQWLDIHNYFDKKIVWDDLKKIIENHFESLKNIFGNDISTLISEWKIELEEDIEGLKNKAKEKIESGINTLFNK